MTNKHTRGLAGPTKLIGWCSASILAALSGGCQDLSSIDARADELVRERSALLGGGEGGGTLAPSRAGTPVGDNGQPRSLLTTPPTNNPSAQSLRFSAADEARDVEARLSAYAQAPSEAMSIDLPTAWRQAQRTAREFLNAEEEYVLSAIRLLVQRHAFDLTLFGSTTTSVTASNTPGEFNEGVPLRILNDLGLSQRLPDGGRLAARLVWDATELLRTRATGRYTQSASLVLSGDIPLLRGAGAVARADLIQAERDLVYAARSFEDFRRQFLVAIARDYFQLLQQGAVIANQERQLESLRQLEQRTGALVEAGRLAEFERNIASSRVLSAQASLASLRENYLLALDRFKVRLGLGVDRAIQIAPFELATPEPDITPEQATRLALEYRLDLQTTRDRLDDAKRTVGFRENALLPDASLFGSVTFRTKPTSSEEFAPREGGMVFEPEDTVLQGGLRVEWPLDRENERLNLRAATIAAQQRERDLAQARDNVVVEVRSRVREIDRARFALTLAEQAVAINRRRLEEQELKKDEVTAQQVVDTENELLDSENARDRARTDLRNAVLNYLLSSAQLRVARDGTLQPLPGMTDSAPENAPQATPPSPTQPAPGEPAPTPPDAGAMNDPATPAGPTQPPRR